MDPEAVRDDVDEGIATITRGRAFREGVAALLEKRAPRSR